MVYIITSLIFCYLILHDVIIINEISFYSKVLVKFDTKWIVHCTRHTFSNIDCLARAVNLKKLFNR